MRHSITSEEQYNRMMLEPIPKLIVSLAIPTVVSMMITVIYNTADTYFVSQINKSAAAAVGAVYAIMAIIQAAGFGLGMGAGSLISRLLGQKRNDEADLYGSSALFAAFFFGLFISAFGLAFLQPFLRLLGCSDTMMPYAEPYAKYILLAAPISCSTFVLNNILRCEGKSALAMIGMGGGGLLNMALDPILIFNFHLQTGGAALATAISQCFSFLLLSWQFVRRRTVVQIKVKYVSRSIRDYGLILATGLPTIFRQGLASLASAVLNRNAVQYGDATVAAVTISGKIYMFLRNFVIGVGQGFQPVAGYNYGAGNKKRTWQAFRFATLLGTAVCIISAALVGVYAEPLMAWFSDDREVIELGCTALSFFAAVTPLLAFSTFVNLLYQCLGFKAPATFLASCRQGIFFVPGVYILNFLLGRTGVLAAQSVADLLTCVISVPFIVVFYRKYLKT